MIARKRLTLIIILLSIVSVAGCSTKSTYTSSEKRNNQWLEDIDYIKTELPLQHHDLFINITEEYFNIQMEELKKDIPKLNDDEIQIRLMEIFTSIKDAHLFIINFHSDLQKIFSVKTFVNLTLDSHLERIIPIKTKWFGDELYVTDVDSEYKEVLGSRVIKINKVPIENAIDKINKIIPHNNQHRLKFLNPMHLVHPAILKHFDLMKKDYAAFTFETKDGNTINKNIKVKDIETVDFVSVLDEVQEKPLYMKKDNLYWYDYLQEEKLLYFNLKTYGVRTMTNRISYKTINDAKDIEHLPTFNDFPEFLKNMISSIEEKEVDKLVVDLRGNNGGRINILNDFYEYIKDNPWFNRKGRLFVIVDKGSFSAPILEAARFRENANAIIIGEPTGEMPFKIFSPGASTLTLPNSKLSILFTKGEISPIEKSVDALTPDIIVNQSFESYCKGVDLVMEKILEFPVASSKTGEVVYQIPNMDKVQVYKDIVYKTDNNEGLKLDVFYSVNKTDSNKTTIPSVVIIHGKTPDKNFKDTDYINSWGRLVAASDYNAITFNWRSYESPKDISDLITYVRENSYSLKINPDNIKIIAFSAGVESGVKEVISSNTGYISSIVAFYGKMPMSILDIPSNKELPSMFIATAGLGNIIPPNTNEAFIKESKKRNCDITEVLHPKGLHGFDLLNNDKETYSIIKDALQFIREN